MKIIPVGAIWDMNRESWYARLTRAVWLAPKSFAAWVAAATTCRQAIRSTLQVLRKSSAEMP